MPVNEQVRNAVDSLAALHTPRAADRRPRPHAEDRLVEQARAITAYLPSLMRQLFTFEDDAVDELPLAQLRVCGLLYAEPRSMSALSRELGVSLSAVTQVADRLERARLVRRVPDGTDRRLRCLQLTERGSRMMRRHEEARMQRVLMILQGLPAPARAEILAALTTLSQACSVQKRRDNQD